MFLSNQLYPLYNTIGICYVLYPHNAANGELVNEWIFNDQHNAQVLTIDM